MQHQTVLNPFEDFSNNTDDDDRDNGQQDVNNVNDSMENMEDNNTIHARSRPMYEELRISIEGHNLLLKI